MHHERVGVVGHIILLNEDARRLEKPALMLARVIGDGAAVAAIRLFGGRAEGDAAVAVDGPGLALGEVSAIAHHPRMRVVQGGLLQH